MSRPGLLEAVRAEQIKIEEALRESFLKEHLFHERTIGDEHDSKELTELIELFIAQKKGKNMGERYALALSLEFFRRIHVVELGITDSPSVEGELDGLKHEYRDLRHFLIQTNAIEGEMDRSSSGRSFDVRRTNVTSERIVVIRNRPLIHTTVPVEGGYAPIGIAKRMVFSIPSGLYVALAERYQFKDINESEKAMQQLEEMMNTGTKERTIDAIRTGYYLVVH